MTPNATISKNLQIIAAADLDEKVQQDVLSGNSLNVDSTPTFFINGQKINKLPGSYEAFKKLIDGEAVKVTPEVVSSEVHEHMDVIIAVNGIKQDLSQDKYMEKYEGLHFHDNFGEVVHKHKLGVTLKDLVDSLKITDLPVTLVKVNKEKVIEWEKYNPQDLDRILISFGDATESQIKILEQKLSDKACIYSEKCPERGKPPTEKCVGGLGTDCK
jgi:sulfur carrier protein ThiS